MTRPVVIGTAGHIDHGKTALVRRLTYLPLQRTVILTAGHAPTSGHAFSHTRPATMFAPASWSWSLEVL